MKSKLLVFVIIAGLVACNNVSVPKESTLTVCSFDEVKKTETVLLSSLVEDCKLIHFENIDEALLKPWFTTVTDKYIGVRQEGNGGYKLFDHSGKFLCNVGSVGQGPGEYAISLYDDLIDDKNELVYLLPMTKNRILVYNTSGQFLRYIDAPCDLHKPKLHLSDDGTLSVIHMPFPGDKAIAFQFNTEGKVVKELAPPNHLRVQSFDGEIFNSRNTSAFEFMHTGSDTLYHYDVKTNRLDGIFTVTTSEKQFKQYIELPHHYLTVIFGKGNILTNKEDKSSSLINVVNDYFGNLEIPTFIVHLRNGWYVYNLEPGQLKEKLENHLTEGKCPEKDKEKLEKLLSELDDNANNVLFLGKLK